MFLQDIRKIAFVSKFDKKLNIEMIAKANSRETILKHWAERKNHDCDTGDAEGPPTRIREEKWVSSIRL